MAEVVGIVSAAVGFAATALHAVRALSNDLDGIKDAPQTITNAKTELQSVRSVIQSLKTSLDQPDWQPVLSDIIRNGNLEATLGACRDACRRFHDELKNLLRHSSEGELSRRDRLTVGFFSKGRVAAFISELSVCKSTIGLALSGTNLMVSMKQFQQLQVLANQHSTESRLRNDEAVDQDLAAGIERGAQLAKGCQGLLAFLQAKVDENRRRIELGNVETLNSARVMAGVNNTDGTEGDINVKVGNVKADGGKALLGYTSKVDVDAFFQIVNASLHLEGINSDHWHASHNQH